ncbi:hypothetical protein AB8B21_30960 [Tardiphaga sp. 866_E4_N2_1]|uniref:hypothetical protein n=1 Tax=unclassified Tardiphaga TaxID=2631404 RepID=UPI003F282FA7
MASLSSGLTAEVLQRLHREAEAADAPLMQTFESEGTTVEQATSWVVEAETRDLTGPYHSYAGNFPSVSPWGSTAGGHQHWRDIAPHRSAAAKAM